MNTINKTKLFLLLLLVYFNNPTSAESFTGTGILSINAGIKGSDVPPAPGVESKNQYLSIRVSGNSSPVGIDPNGCYEKNIVLMSDHVYFNELFSMLLTAHSSNTKVNLVANQVEGVQAGTIVYCKLHSVEMVLD